MTKIRLTDLQSVLLSSAARNDEGSLLPVPDSLARKPAEVERALRQLLKRELVTETEQPKAGAVWRSDGDLRFGLVIADKGRAAIGVEEPPKDEPERQPSAIAPMARSVAPAPQTKAANVLAMLGRPEGAILAELVDATGWLPHTTRAALTGLRKKGHHIAKGKRGQVTCYSIAAAEA